LQSANFTNSSLEAEVSQLQSQLQESHEQVEQLNSELKLLAVYQSKSLKVDDMI
jgi:predicted RNase H-like nuclease (RuvC/YqgF family)